MSRRSYKARNNRSRFSREKGRRFTASDALDLDAMATETVRAKGGFKIPRYYFTMHSIDKVGVRPLPGYSRTPLGVYGYPLTASHLKMLREGHLPYRQKAPNVTVLEITDPGNCLAFKDTKKGEENVQFYHSLKEIADRVFKEYTKDLKPGAYRQDPKFAYLLNSYLRNEGYTSVYDAGTGTIHVNEPHQVCFLEPSAFRVVRSIPQSLVRAERSSSELFQAMNAFKQLAAQHGLTLASFEFIKPDAFYLGYDDRLVVGIFDEDDNLSVGLLPLREEISPDVYDRMLATLDAFMVQHRGSELPIRWMRFALYQGLRKGRFSAKVEKNKNSRVERVELLDDKGVLQARITNSNLFDTKRKPISIYLPRAATKQTIQEVERLVSIAPNLFAVRIARKVKAKERKTRKKKMTKKMTKKKLSPVAKPNRGRFDRVRYAVRDLNDPDWVFPLDASSGEEAMVEAWERACNRRGDYEVFRITDSARMNPRRALYTLLYEHTTGKRGDLLGLPGTGEMHFIREKDHTGRLEPLQMTQARVGKWIVQLRRMGHNDDSEILVIDRKGDGIDPDVFLEAYEAVNLKGYMVRNNPRRL